MATTWHPHEVTLTAATAPSGAYERFPVARFEHESGATYEVPGFWDGGDVYRVRFAPPATGTWEWAVDDGDAGVRESGSFEAAAGEGETALHEHGFLRADGRALVHADGTPFFWLADTAWAAGTRATPAEWERYLDERVAQGYDVVQVNALAQHDASLPHDRLPFGEDWDLDAPDPAYFRALDGLVAAAHERGVVPALVALWFDYVPGTNADWGFPEEKRHQMTGAQARDLGRYLGARYGAYGAVWLVSGDSDFDETSLAVYRAAAEGLGEACTHPLLTAHQPGSQVTPEAVNEEPWLDFHLYQSSHTDDLDLPAEMARDCRALDPPRPVVNGEPCYDGMYNRDPAAHIGRETVRAAGWVSVLGGGNAGLTYGALGVWNWHREGDEFPPADHWGDPPGWEAALSLPSARDYGRLRRLLSTYEVVDLDPRPGLLADDRPGEAAAVLPDAVLVYLREGRAVTLRDPPAADHEWVDPATGRRADAAVSAADAGAGTVAVAAPPFGGDALLVGER